MSKIFLIARRDFLATVSTKGFIIAIMVPPLIYTAIITVFPRLMSNRVPAVSGGLVVIDQAGQVTPGVRRYLEPQAMAARREAAFNRAMESAPMGGAASSGAGGAVARRAVMGESTTIEITESPAGALEQEKQQLARDDGVRRLGVLVIHPHAVAPDAEGKLGAYDLFVRRNLDIRIQNEIRNGAADAIVDARVRAAGLDRQRIDALTTVARPGVDHRDREWRVGDETGFRAAPADGVRAVADDFGHEQRPVPVDDDDRREVEPDDGGDSVGGVAVRAADRKNPRPDGRRSHDSRHVLLDRHSEPGVHGDVGSDRPVAARVSVHLFLITYVTMGSLMAAIGSSVNELREAQSLMTPITLLMMIPWLFWFPISREPNSLFATVVSFIPPMNAFAMLLRLTSTSPPPMWQVWLSIAVGIIAAGGALWFASRVFKIGLLMHGRPPNFATLLKWARQA